MNFNDFSNLAEFRNYVINSGDLELKKVLDEFYSTDTDLNGKYRDPIYHMDYKKPIVEFLEGKMKQDHDKFYRINQKYKKQLKMVLK